MVVVIRYIPIMFTGMTRRTMEALAVDSVVLRIDAPIINTPLPGSIAGRLINVKPGDSKALLCHPDPVTVGLLSAVKTFITGAI